MLYEGVILFGVVFIAGYLFSTLTQQRNGLTHHNLLDAWIGLVLAVLFRLVLDPRRPDAADENLAAAASSMHTARPLTAARAIVRYVLAWLWFLPPLALHPLLGLAVPQTLVVFAAIWFVLWAAAVWLDPARQFLHDRLAGTRIVAVQLAS